MSDIREKVARAISGSVRRVIEKYPDGSELVSGIDHKTSLTLADAALSASGHAELVEALEKIASLHAQDSMRPECCGNWLVSTSSRGEPIGEECCGHPNILGEWNDIARAALKKARGT